MTPDDAPTPDPGVAKDDTASQSEIQGGLTEAEKRETFVQLVFDGDQSRFEEFRQTIRDVVPAGTRAIVRGSAVTGVRWKDQAPFDADGPGTSDIDLTLVGADILGAFKLSGFYVPGLHSRPMGDEDPDIAPALADLREALTRLAGRPVNVQASHDIVILLRGDLGGQPYLTLLGDDDA